MDKPGVRVAVLAGGRGSRLGGAKAGALLGGRPMVAHVLDAALASGLPVLVVAKPSSVLPPLDVEVVREPEEPRHPLAGVLAALRSLPEEDSDAAVVAVGCDMPFLTAPLLAWLASSDGAVALRSGGYLQPLPARYPRAALESLEQSLRGRRRLRDAFCALGPRILEERRLAAFGDPRRLCFSVNDARDLRTAEAWLADGE